MQKTQSEQKRDDMAALRYGFVSLIIGMAFCGSVLLARSIFLLGFGGLLALSACLFCILKGAGSIFRDGRGRGRFSSWRVWVGLAVLIGNIPVGAVCSIYTLKHFSDYTITIVNNSPKPLESVGLSSAFPRNTAEPKHRFSRIEPGQSVRVTWNARDEEGVLLCAIWNGQVYETNVTGYTIWESPKDYDVQIDSSGSIFSNGRKLD